MAAIVYLIVSSAQADSQYFLTIEELENRAEEMVGRTVRVSGVVLGDSIKYDDKSLMLEFTAVHVPADNDEIEALGGMASILRPAAQDSSLPRLRVTYEGMKPDLMNDEAHAIMTGRLGEDGIFYADELLMKCPTKYEDSGVTPTR